MKSLVFVALASVVLSAQADIPRRPTHVEVDSVEVEGQAAVELYDSLKVKVLKGSALRTSFSTHKVFRSSDELTQVVCTKETSRMNDMTTGRCKVQQSTNGEKLPKFKPVIRMG